ncbi:MAG TPA: peptidylprolyl isomerase, partial [Pseudobdellovibrionaceae bacterium]|nr:peptidylprolyl isomerase [Pseudobdellovibrionaceae bacterium]
HVFFNPKKSSEKSPLDRATATYEKIKSGQSFESAAEQFSEDPQFENNGFLGHFKAGEFLQEIESKILTMNVGEVTPPLKTKMGIHIFKLLDKKMTVDSNFEKEKEKISSVLLERAFRAQLPIWLESKRTDASIILNEK